MTRNSFISRRNFLSFRRSRSFNYIVLTLIYLIVILVLTRFKYAYGSELDWSSQHYAFPDYFRKLFYETGDLFPSFAPGLGAGENIYYYAYYGLFSPIIMLSYLFPFLEMSLYIQLMSIVVIWLSIMLFYRFLSKRFRRKTAFICGLLFLTSSPIMFHSHRHIMFVSYMPFLILALEAVDLLYERQIKAPLIICVAAITLTSYFFSPPSIIVIIIYGIYSFIRKNRYITIKKSVSESMNFIFCIIAGLMISAILIIPTLASILCGRETTNSGISIYKLLPFSGMEITGLGAYSMGVSAFGIMAVIAAIVSKKNRGRRFLGIVLGAIILCPAFTYILNAGMYLDGKVLIPFIPLTLILTAHAYEEFLDDSKKTKLCVLILSIFTVTIIINNLITENVSKGSVTKIFFADSVVSIILILLYLKYNRKIFLISTMTLMTFCAFATWNMSDTLMTTNQIKDQNNLFSNEMLEKIDSDENIFRSSTDINKAGTVNLFYGKGYYSSYTYSSLHNKLYNDFYFEKIQNENEYRNSSLTTNSSNILFNIFMGNKYLLTENDYADIGYSKIMTQNGLNLWKNEHALTIGRSSDKYISKKNFEKLSDPEKMEALVKCVIIDTDEDRNDYQSTCCEYNENIFPENELIQQSGDSYFVNSKEEIFTSLKLNKPIPKDKLLIIFMDVENLSENFDARITINNERNTLTNPNWKYFNNNYHFSFVLNSKNKENLESLDYVFSDGEYEIKNIKAFTIDFPDKIQLTGKFQFDKESTCGDIINGSIECENDGYFLLTIPYEKGFDIKVDGVHQDYEAVNYAFIGFPISKGSHRITVEYNAPFQTFSLIISALGIVILLLTFIFSDVKKMKKSVDNLKIECYN